MGFAKSLLREVYHEGGEELRANSLEYALRMTEREASTFTK
jgi:hypothetical protein